MIGADPVIIVTGDRIFDPGGLRITGHAVGVSKKSDQRGFFQYERL